MLVISKVVAEEGFAILALTGASEGSQESPDAVRRVDTTAALRTPLLTRLESRCAVGRIGERKGKFLTSRGLATPILVP